MNMHKHQGFTLIEVVIAVAILMTAMTAVFTIYSWCTAEVRRARQRTHVTLCAQRMLEMIASAPQHVLAYDGFSTTALPAAGNPVAGDLRTWQACVRELSRSATGQITVSDDPETPYATLVQVSIQYDNYGRETTLSISQKLPARAP